MLLTIKRDSDGEVFKFTVQSIHSLNYKERELICATMQVEEFTIKTPRKQYLYKRRVKGSETITVGKATATMHVVFRYDTKQLRAGVCAIGTTKKNAVDLCIQALQKENEVFTQNELINLYKKNNSESESLKRSFAIVQVSTNTIFPILNPTL